MVLLSSKDILCESHNAIHLQHLRCVLCTHRHHIVPLGAANRFVWPGSLFCLPPSLSPQVLPSYPRPPPMSQNLILKKDYQKTTWVISCRPENYPPVEKTPKPLSTSYLPSLSPSISLWAASRDLEGRQPQQQRRDGGVRMVLGGRQKSISPWPCSLNSLPAEIWRATTTEGDWEGRRDRNVTPQWASLCWGEKEEKEEKRWM